MGTDSKGARTARVQTDESLRSEREKADQSLAAKQAAVHDHADQVVDRAREHADATLLAARDKADLRLSDAPAESTVAAIAVERRDEDRTISDERAAADEAVRKEREQTARALAKLLPLEREKTDRHLLTERARSDDALSNRDDFLGIVSHDLRDLLGGIVMSAGLLSEPAPSPSDPEEQIRLATGRIERYAARMNRLIGDLVDVASIDAGRLAYTVAPGDARTLVGEVVETFRGAAAAKQLSLGADSIEGPLLAEFDHDRIFQVFANLISNAIKFTPAGGSITIHAERAERTIRFSVRDSGKGIPAEMLESVFERFWQVGKFDRRGSGLGLYISKCLVEAHGGTIWAESVLGEGSTFVFTLPTA